ncbi:MAG: SOS response-associated peptidase [Candidatus Microthrix sp.]|nr:SOS response-associated peptidase [Candidatus Microthrix sp.]
MCGRFVSTTPPDELASYFQVDANGVETPGTDGDDRPPGRYNVAPTAEVFVVYEDGDLRRLDGFHWGLVPSWAKDLKIGNRMINARAETIAEKPAFRRAFAKRRCIVPADGFYEWTQEPDPTKPGKQRKQPHFISRPDGEPYAFAGLWERWRGDLNGDGTETEVRSTTIITTTANEPMAELHDRMPVMLAPGDWEAWLDPTNADVDALGQLLVPAPPRLITHHPVSTEVNNARNQGPQLIEPVDPPPPDFTWWWG